MPKRLIAMKLFMKERLLILIILVISHKIAEFIEEVNHHATIASRLGSCPFSGNSHGFHGMKRCFQRIGVHSKECSNDSGYYFISLFFSAAIMWTLRKTTNDEKLLAILEKRYQENKNNPKKASGLMARMQALQELQRQQQEEMQRKQAELNEKKNNLGK